jgi:hypothetical protein
VSGLRRAVMWTTLLAASVLLAFDQGVAYADRTYCTSAAADCDLGLLWGAWYAGVTIGVWALVVVGVEIWLRHRKPRRGAA